MCIRDRYIIQIDHADIKAMTAEIQKIGVDVYKRQLCELSIKERNIEFKAVLAYESKK